MRVWDRIRRRVFAGRWTEAATEELERRAACIGHGQLEVDGRTIAEDAEVTVDIVADTLQLEQALEDGARAVAEDMQAMARAQEFRLLGELRGGTTFLGAAEDGPVGEATVQPIPAPTECWRCWAAGVDEGDELGLCDRCKADLQEGRTIDVGDETVVHELYSWQSAEPVATVRHGADEPCPRCGIRVGPDRSALVWPDWNSDNVTVQLGERQVSAAPADEEHHWSPAVYEEQAREVYERAEGISADSYVREQREFIDQVRAEAAWPYAREPITPDPDARPSEHVLQRPTTTDRRGCFIPRSEAEQTSLWLPQELALEAGVEYRMQWRETEDGFFVEVWTF